MDTKKLRQKILDLAIRGKLVPQDPNDEPASVLLKRIRAEKERLIKEGKIKRSKKTVTEDEIEAPFEIPESWEWVRLDDLAFYKKGPFGSSLTKSMFVPDTPDAFKVYEQKNAINKDASLGYYFIDAAKYEELKGFAVSPSDIIVSCAGTIGETYVLPKNIREGIINQALMLIRLYDIEITDFYLLYFDFILKTEAAKESKGTAIKNIPPFDVLKNFLIPIPPLAEQHRIIEEVNYWMHFVNIIDGNSNDVVQLITKAKSKILDLAIHGKLVPQDPNDEPAIELLKRINPKFEPYDNALYENIPSTWCWCRLGDLYNIVSAKRVHKSEWQREGVPFYRAREIVRLAVDGYVDNDLFISKSHYEEIRDKYGIPKATDIMISAVGTIGKTYIVKENDLFYYKDASVICLQNINGLYSPFISILLSSQLLQTQMFDQSKGTTVDTITIEKANSYIIPIPPIPEQLRIVAKIEELFAVLGSIKESLE